MRPEAVARHADLPQPWAGGGTVCRRVAAVALLVFIGNATPAAAPYTPASDDIVLERVATSDASRRELRALRDRIAADPAEPQAALELAGRFIELARASADPRYNGQAEAVLAPLLSQDEAPAEAWVLQATLLQNRHDFDGALDRLDQALRQRPSLTQAWLTRAAVFEARGDYPQALKSCMALIRSAPAAIAATCVDSALSLGGHAQPAYRHLSRVLQSHRLEPAQSQWAQLVAAEMAERLGLTDTAERHYRAALALPQRNVYLLAALADLLLDTGRPAQVRELLRDETRADSLLLRLALAERELGSADFSAHAEWLEARFAASRLRGDTTHQGEEARFLLRIRQAPERALDLAIDNWRVQREPRDARILLESALAANRPDAAGPVLTFLAESGLQDVRLDELAGKLRPPR